ncbi:hypothetical protein Tco_0953378 [Tanacetum coccineum]|uniref:Uncharacterized protein n=1 Tax=Tanacetum coccineum TaxID=301880 RepID=A0ABQ5E027_9ASTR
MIPNVGNLKSLSLHYDEQENKMRKNKNWKNCREKLERERAVGHTIDSLSIFPSAYYEQWRSYEEIGEGYGPPTTLSHSVNAYPPILRNFDMSEREKETPGSQVKGVFDDLSAEHLPLCHVFHDAAHGGKCGSAHQPSLRPSDKVPVEPVSVLVEKSSAKPVPPSLCQGFWAPLAARV